MSTKSAGILMYRIDIDTLKVFLVHPGGPYWAKKDLNSWSVPKGLYEEDEAPLDAAKREFYEETGFRCEGDFRPLQEIKQPSGKKILAWAVEGDCDANNIISNTFTLEWPPKSGKHVEFPEVDKAEWFTIEKAANKIIKGQLGFLKELCSILGYEFQVADVETEKLKNTTKSSKNSKQGSLF